jgi:molecular chaperone IbpA
MTNFTGRVSFGPIHPSIFGTSLGYDSMFDELERLVNSQPNTSEKYPPHNILKLDDYRYIVELAVAGFSKEEIEITVNDGKLIIKGEKEVDNAPIEYLHKGISARSFTKTINLIDTIEIQGASYKDGILSIALENVIPESKKPRKIEINDELVTVPTDTKQLLTE